MTAYLVTVTVSCLLAALAGLLELRDRKADSGFVLFTCAFAGVAAWGAFLLFS